MAAINRAVDQVQSQFSCDSNWKAAIAGAAAAVTGLDALLPLPRAVHWAAAGVGIDAYCKGGMPAIDAQLAMCAVGGYVGGLAIAVAQNRQIPLTGPLL